MEFVDLKKQYQLHKECINRAIQTVLDNANFIMGKEVKTLEARLAEYVNVKYCLGVSSGTDALLIALMALNIGPGDEVISTPLTWVSTIEVIARLGAKPVFVDIDPNTLNIDFRKIENSISSKTKAVIPVSLNGSIANLDEINNIAQKYKLTVIEDGAQSFGAQKNEKKSCSMTDIATTSFFPAKPFGCYGDGGAIFTRDDKLYERMNAIRLHGGKKRDHYEYLGINGRLDTLQAAILLEKLKFFDQELEIKRRIANKYDEELKDIVTLLKSDKSSISSYAQYTIRVDDRDALRSFLKEYNVPSAVYYPICVHEQPLFKYLNYKKGDFPEAEKAAKEIISLPINPYLSLDEQNQVIDLIKVFVNQKNLVGANER